MAYKPRKIVSEDSPVIAVLYAEFIEERERLDPSLSLKPSFDFEAYIRQWIDRPFSVNLALEQEESGEVVGFLLTYVYDEAPPPFLDSEAVARHELSSPFIPRRVGTVLGLYVREGHRSLLGISQLIEAALAEGEALQITDIDLLISAEQTGIHRLLERAGFTRSAVQYTKHYEVEREQNLPSLHPEQPELASGDRSVGEAIPLFDPRTKERVYNSQGEPVFLEPVKDESGKVLVSSNGRVIYPMPLLDPQTRSFVFDREGNLVVRPLLREENGEIVEDRRGIPQFNPPLYRYEKGKMYLQRNEEGKYLFAREQRDETGKIKRSTEGKPLFASGIA